MIVQDCCFNIKRNTKKACWVLTYHCNLTCNYCAANSHKQLLGDSIIRKDVCRKVVRTCNKSGISKIILSGGEPLIINNLIEIVEFLSVNKLKTTICSNGTLLSARLLSNLKNAGLSKITIGIDIFKIIPGSKSYDVSYNTSISNALNIIEKYNATYELNIVFLPISDSEIYKLANWLRKLRPVSVNIIKPQACGRLITPGKSIVNNWDEKQLEEAVTNLINLIYPVNSVFVSPRCQDHDCPSEKLLFGINPDGDLGQCHWKHNLKILNPKQISLKGNLI